MALAAYPLVGILVFDWWNSGYASQHHTMILPPDVKVKREIIGRRLILLKYAILLLILWGIAGYDVWRSVLLPIHREPPIKMLIAGTASGFLMLALHALLSVLVPDVSLSHRNEYFLRGSTSLWVAILIVGAFVEESWQALCIVSFIQNGYSPALICVMTGFAFSLARQSGLPSRIAPGLGNAGSEVLMGSILGAVYVWSGDLIAPTVANMIYYLFGFMIARQTKNMSDAPG